MTGVAAALAWLAASLPAHAQARQVFPGGLEQQPRAFEQPGLAASVLGVQVKDPPGVPVVFYRGTASGKKPEGIEWSLVTPERGVTLSSTGRNVLFHGMKGDQTWFQSPDGPPLSGSQRFLIGDDGRTTIAFSMERGERTVQRFAAHEPVKSWSTPDLRWVSLSADGHTVAVGERNAVKLHRSPGQLEFPDLVVVSSSGALSPDGAWLALESERDRAVTLSWIHVRESASPPVESMQVAPGGRLRFAADGRLAAHVAPGAVTFFRSDDGGPQRVARREVPDQSLRSVAFDRQGRIALGRLHVEKRPYRDPTDVAAPFRPGLARVTVEFLESATGEVASSVEWTVPLWSYIAPALDFAPDGSCLANCGHSVHKVEPPWPR